MQVFHFMLNYTVINLYISGGGGQDMVYDMQYICEISIYVTR